MLNVREQIQLHIQDGLLDEDILFADNFDEALVGLCHAFGKPTVACYDREKCVEIIMRDSSPGDLTEEERYSDAVEFFEFNVIGSYVGEHTPVYITRYEQESGG
tara:strand:- start:160 stop:471 length:312 start_codon:yes stop_codon:yes gene_type:complete